MIRATPPCPLTLVLAGRAWTRMGGKVMGKVGISTRGHGNKNTIEDITLNIISIQNIQCQDVCSSVMLFSEYCVFIMIYHCTIFSCIATLYLVVSVCLSVRPSVRLSVCLFVCPKFLSQIFVPKNAVL